MRKRIKNDTNIILKKHENVQKTIQIHFFRKNNMDRHLKSTISNSFMRSTTTDPRGAYFFLVLFFYLVGISHSWSWF